MTYRTRIGIAVACSIVLHSLLLAALGRTHRSFSLGMVEPRDPVVVRLQPEAPPLPEAPEPRRLIEVSAEDSEPAAQTDLIADRNAKARDQSDRDSGTNRPAADLVDEFDRLAAVVPSPAAPPLPAPPEAALAGPAELAEAAVPAAEAPEPAAAPAPTQVSRLLEPAALAAPSPQAAQSPPPSTPSPDESPGESRARIEGGVVNEGFLNFEAIRDEVAPYMRTIRKEVERRWRSLVYLQYKNTKPAKAVIDCAINPQGDIVFVRIADPGDSALFAAICKEAMEKAGPFGPFPFEVPDIYRNKNLEIRWTFRFL